MGKNRFIVFNEKTGNPQTDNAARRANRLATQAIRKSQREVFAHKQTKSRTALKQDKQAFARYLSSLVSLYGTFLWDTELYIVSAYQGLGSSVGYTTYGQDSLQKALSMSRAGDMRSR